MRVTSLVGCGANTHVTHVRQDVVGHDLGQRGVTRVGDRETVGAVGTRVDLGDLAGRNEVGVLLPLTSFAMAIEGVVHVECS